MLHKDRKMLKKQNGINIFGCSNVTHKKYLGLAIMCCGFQKKQNKRFGNLPSTCMELTIYNIVLLVTLGNVEPHPFW
jgi:hypothetical protein